MSESKPLVTIGAINYNNGKYVIETLDSIANQTYENIELIVVDDASTDNSLTLIKDWLKNYKKPYKLIVHSENMNVHAGYMSVIKNATGEFLSIVATDDVLVNEKTEKQVEAFANLGDEYGVVYGDIIRMNENSELISTPNFERIKNNKPNWSLPQGDIFLDLIADWVFYVQAALFKKKILDGFYFPEKYKIEDRYFLLYATRNTKVLGAEDVCVLYRVREGSISNLATKNENYHLWSLSDVRMYLEIAQFSEFSKKKLIALNKKIQEQILRYAYHKDANYMIAVKEWYRSLSLPKRRNQLHSFFYINWFFLQKKLNILRSDNK